MAAPAPAPTPDQQQRAWTDFNLDVWRPGRRPRGEPGIGGVKKGLNTVWTTFTPAEQFNIYQVIQNYIANETLLAALPAIPAQVPNGTAAMNAVQDYFRAIDDRIELEEALVEVTTTLINLLPRRPVREKLETHRNNLNDTVTQHEQSLGTIRDIRRRCRECAEDIAPAAPSLGPPAPDYSVIRECFVNHIDILRQRLVDRETLRRDFDNAINDLSTGTGDLAVSQRRCLVAMRNEQNAALTRLRSTVTVLDMWLQNDPRDGEPHKITAPGAPLPDVGNLTEFVETLDDFKSFHDAAQRMHDFYNAQFPAPPAPADVARAELRSLGTVIEHANEKHEEWLQQTPAHIQRMKDTFKAKWEDNDHLLNGDEKVAFREFVQKVVEQREIMDAELGQAWIGPVFLGEGGHGKVSLWIKQDMAGRIVDRVTVKETVNYNSNDDASLGVWKAPQPISLEVAAMYKLKHLPGSDYIVKIRNFKTKAPVDGKLAYRFYAEYCKGGDLVTFRDNYHELEVDPLSEPYLWSIFDSLVTAGLLMEGDHLPKTTPPLWEQIVHGDMKANNVLLADNSTDRFRGWQVAKLSDFGLAMIVPTTGIQPPHNWEAFSGNWVAPEMTKIYNTAQEDGEEDEAGSLYPMSPANVWGAGFVMREMMHTSPWTELWENDEDGELVEPTAPPPFTAADEGRYRAELRDLVMSCLAPYPDDRPTFTQLRDAIIAETGPAGPDPRLTDLRNAPNDDPRFIIHGAHRSVDNYAIGLAIDDLPADTLPYERRIARPTADSANEEIVGGQLGGQATVLAPVQDPAQYVKDSVKSNKRTFDKISC
ncbi:hypothetical protein AC579_5768 [Pseudocercospora musae]|uniref:Protein kinase domain-containing protein n=1 Tax=Pseudocercospora musae TaxID=113226 RepID=A0A139HAY6_9PEZI|nr:hypothetical protein AC579_5768 [Pseudocercospora musae]